MDIHVVPSSRGLLLGKKTAKQLQGLDMEEKDLAFGFFLGGGGVGYVEVEAKIKATSYSKMIFLRKMHPNSTQNVEHTYFFVVAAATIQ